MMRKVATIKKSKTHNRQSKSRPISVSECLIIPLSSTQREVGPGRHLASLHHWCINILLKTKMLPPSHTESGPL